MTLWRASRTGISLGYSCASLVLPSMSVKRKVTVPEGRLFMCFLQRKRHGFFHGQPLSIGRNLGKLRIIQLGMDNFQITFHRFLLDGWAMILYLFTHGICPGQELSSAFKLTLIHIQAG